MELHTVEAIFRTSDMSGFGQVAIEIAAANFDRNALHSSHVVPQCNSPETTLCRHIIAI
jgi:hypothetical protein